MKTWRRKFFTRDDETRIIQAIRKAEAKTSGEIRVTILRSCNEDVLDRAKHEFSKLKMEKTRDHTGVMILLVLGERKFAVWADQGIYEKIPQGIWNNLAETMSAHFRRGKYRAGIVEAVVRAGTMLHEHFPRRVDDTNELPDAPVFEAR